MNFNLFLPIELVNKVLIMRTSHPNLLILKPYIYNCDGNNCYNHFSFIEYTLDKILRKYFKRVFKNV